MKTTKNPKLEWKSKRPVFFLASLALSQLFVLAAFSFKSTRPVTSFTAHDSQSYDTFTMIEPTLIVSPPPPPVSRNIPVMENPNATQDLVVFDEPDSNWDDQLEEAISKLQKNTAHPPVDKYRIGDEAHGYFSIEPEFEGGEEALFSFVQEHLNYPPDALRYEVEGVVYARFVIDPYGNIIDISLKIKPEIEGYGLEEAAMKMIQKMPPWKPGVIDNKPAHFVYQLPIRFEIQK